MKKLYFPLPLIAAFIICLSCTVCGQNVGINATGATPDASAGLDVDFANKGVLVPRVALTSTGSASPVTSPATGLLVYNTAAAGSSPNNVVSGFYYWNGTRWVALSTNAWSVTGNAGTTPGSSFIGTTDNISLRFRTNNVQQMILDSLGNLGIGTTIPGALLDIGQAGSTRGVVRIAGNTSGNVTIQPAATAGTWAMTLPTSAGSNGNVLQTDGTGVTTWVAPSAGVRIVVQGSGTVIANCPAGKTIEGGWYRSPSDYTPKACTVGATSCGFSTGYSDVSVVDITCK